jgi:hypothetical protein
MSAAFIYMHNSRKALSLFSFKYTSTEPTVQMYCCKACHSVDTNLQNQICVYCISLKVHTDKNICVKYAYFNVFGSTITRQNCIYTQISEQIKFWGCLLLFSSEPFIFQFSVSIYIKIKMYGTVILPLVLCGFETSFFTLSEEHGLKVSDSRVTQ